MQVVRQWTVQGNHVGMTPAAHPFLAHVGALAQAAAHQAAGAFQAGQSEGAADLGGAVSDLLNQIPVPGQGVKPVDHGAAEEGGGGAVQWQGPVVPGQPAPTPAVQTPAPTPGGGGGGGGGSPAATMVTCPDASVHPAGFVCPQKASPLGAMSSWMSDWGLWALLGVGAAGGYMYWQHNKKKKAAGVHDRETIPAWEAAGHV